MDAIDVTKLLIKQWICFQWRVSKPFSLFRNLDLEFCILKCWIYSFRSHYRRIEAYWLHLRQSIELLMKNSFSLSSSHFGSIFPFDSVIYVKLWFNVCKWVRYDPQLIQYVQQACFALFYSVLFHSVRIMF